MLKRLFRWLVRTVVTVIVILVIMVIADYISHRVQAGSVLVVTLRGPMVERGSTGLSGLISAGRETPLNVVRYALNLAARDSRISGVAVKLIDPEMEFAQAQELAVQLRKLAGRGKWTAAYLETAGEFGPGNLPYVVAAATQDVSIMPQGELNLIGVGMRELFARGALDWLGIRPDFDAIGQYKTAMNVFTEKDFTPAQREADNSLVDSLYQQLINQVAGERNLSADAVRALIDRAPLTAEDGLKARLVDRLEYPDQFTARIKNYKGRKRALVDYASYARPSIVPSLESHPKIAVIYGSGDIERGSGGVGSTGLTMASDKMAAAFKAAREDDSVKAVIFRIDSPGGSVLGSELIRRAAELTARKKPVIVSMSGFAASGGYWVSTPALRIFADPATVTGSIGVLGGKFNIAPAAQKLGVNSGAVTRGANVEMFDEFTDFTPAQAKMMHDQVLGQTYQRFVKLVAESRHMTFEQVDQIAQGRVWTGAQALELKLVDTIGGFDAALKAAKEAAKIGPEERVELVELPEQPGLLEQLLGGGLDARAGLAPAMRLPRPWNWLLRSALLHRGAVGAAYCPVVPVM